MTKEDNRPHLFKCGHSTYGVCVPGMVSGVNVARSYLRAIGVKNTEYLGRDNRTPKQQYDSFTIGVAVPEGWRPPVAHMED